MADYKFSPISPKSPDHDYFPKSIFRRSTASTTVPSSPVSEKAAGKARAQPSTPLIQSQTHTPISPAFPSPTPSQIQNSADRRYLNHQHRPTIPEDEEAQHHDQAFLSDVPLNTYAYSPEIRTASQTSQADYEARMAHARKLQKIDKYIGYTLGVISLGLALIMDVILAYVLHKFYTTKDIPAPGRVGPWAVGTELWPAYMLLAASSVTFLIDGSTLIAACCVLRSSRKRKGQRDLKGSESEIEKEESSNMVVAARAESALVKCGYVAFVAKWFIIATLYRTGKTTKDLWGWSCDSRAANIQKYYVHDLNFATLCRVQTASWAMSITEMILKTLLMAFIFWLSHKLKKLRKERQQEIREGKGKMVETNEVGAELGAQEEKEKEPRQGIQRPPSVIWYSIIEASKMLGQSGK